MMDEHPPSPTSRDIRELTWADLEDRLRHAEAKGSLSEMAAILNEGLKQKPMPAHKLKVLRNCARLKQTFADVEDYPTAIEREFQAFWVPLAVRVAHYDTQTLAAQMDFKSTVETLETILKSMSDIQTKIDASFVAPNKIESSPGFAGVAVEV